MPSYPWYHPTGWIRKDAYEREDADVGQQVVSAGSTACARSCSTPAA